VQRHRFAARPWTGPRDTRRAGATGPIQCWVSEFGAASMTRAVTPTKTHVEGCVLPEKQRESVNLEPHFEDVQAHYDLSDEFFALFLDPTRTYSCAYFERDDMTLEEAQLAKVDLSLGKLGLQPGMTLLDIGCGWGTTIIRALERYDVNVVGLTLSRNQQAHVQRRLDQHPSTRSKRVLLRGWEQFDEKVDRIVSIGAFEHFGRDRYTEFFKMAYEALPADGTMLLHTIIKPSDEEFAERGLPITMTKLRFMKFIMDEIFPGGDLPNVKAVEQHAQQAGFGVKLVQPLRLHYARTLDTWAAALQARRDEAIAIQSQEVYDRYMKYLTGCADLFREGYTDVAQFTLTKG
jgi:cyclopropane-fatty-acyl-phospholipid synthase